MAIVWKKPASCVIEEDGFVFKKVKKAIQVGKGTLASKTKEVRNAEEAAAAMKKEADARAARLKKAATLRKEVSRLKALRDQLSVNEQNQEAFLREGNVEVGPGSRETEGNAACLASDDQLRCETRQLADKLEESAAAVNRTLELQVDAIESMLEGIEDMIDQAEKLSAQVATDFHEDVFSGLPAHTPRTLIRRLAAVQPTAG